MKRNFRFLAMACLFFCPVVANADLIDFDNLPGGGTLATNTILTDQYDSLGVNFSALEDSGAVSSAVVDAFVSDNPPGNSGNYWGNTEDNGFTAKHDILRIEFSAPVTDVKWYTQSHGGAFITFRAYDAAGILIDSVNASGSFVATSLTANNISRIDALQPSDSWSWGLDNLSFSAASVPEPNAFALFGVGAWLFAITSRRRKK